MRERYFTGGMLYLASSGEVWDEFRMVLLDWLLHQGILTQFALFYNISPSATLFIYLLPFLITFYNNSRETLIYYNEAQRELKTWIF